MRSVMERDTRYLDEQVIQAVRFRVECQIGLCFRSSGLGISSRKFALSQVIGNAEEKTLYHRRFKKTNDKPARRCVKRNKQKMAMA